MMIFGGSRSWVARYLIIWNGVQHSNSILPASRILSTPNAMFDVAEITFSTAVIGMSLISG
jgi:hypothetical protein